MSSNKEEAIVLLDSLWENVAHSELSPIQIEDRVSDIKDLLTADEEPQINREKFLELARDVQKFYDEEPECTCIVHEKLGGSTFTNPNNCPIHAPVQSVDKLSKLRESYAYRDSRGMTVGYLDLIELINALESKVNQ